MPPRRAGAPRLIEWTGERAVPWAPDVQVVYEHYHRYLWAQLLVSDRRVLDIGSGEGFGAALLADVAAAVTGVDVDAQAVEHSRLNYAGGNLSFFEGSATDLSAFPDASFDAIVAFEIVEHVAAQEEMLAEIARLLTDDGIVIVSTPDRRAYSEATGQDNPFHVRELSEGEFRALLGTQFPVTRLFGQRTATGSRIERLADDRSGDSGPAPGASSFALERAGDEWRAAGRMSPMYLLAVAARRVLPEVLDQSALSDYGLELLRATERSLNDLVQLQASTVALARADAKQLTELRRRRVEEKVLLARKVDNLVRRAEAAELQLAEGLADRDRRTERMHRELQGIQESVSWRAFQKLRGKLYVAIGGRNSAAGKMLGMVLCAVGRAAASRRAVADVRGEPVPTGGPTHRPIIFPVFEAPLVSIVIAVYDGAEITERCLTAVLHSTDVPYEVIVVDDGSDPQVRRLLDALSGVHVIRNETNLGYLRSVNRGSAVARGAHILQLNNDTEPQPGWLTALVKRMDGHPDVGIVVPKLLFPDGTLQEAGSIIWRDGGASNYGHGADPTRYAYNFARDVDYGSAAAMLVRGTLWRELGGFDQRYVPGYYEDVDLCFAARDAGLRVVYEPTAVVIHAAGASMGVNVEVGLKRYQQINAAKFAARWAQALQDQLPGPAAERVDTAADRRRGRRVFIADHGVPRPDADAGSLRMFHVVKNFVDLGYRVTFLPDDHAAPAPYTALLQEMGVEVLYGDVDLPARLTGLAADAELAILSRPYVAARYLHLVREYLPHAGVAYDTVDLHYVREARRAEMEEGVGAAKSTSFKELELGLARGSDVTVTVSQEEADLLEEQIPGLPVHVVPLAHDVWVEVPPRARRSGLLFVGNFGHTPNVDSAMFLVDVIMPLVWRELPRMRLTIVGGNAPPSVLGLSQPNVEIAGWVPQIDPLIAEAIAMVAPLRYGAGVKGKVVQSLACGLPIVTTPVGAEGLDVESGRELLIGDTAAELAAQIVRLAADHALWQTLSESGQELMRETGSPQAQREQLTRLLLAVGHNEWEAQEDSQL